MLLPIFLCALPCRLFLRNSMDTPLRTCFARKLICATCSVEIRRDAEGRRDSWSWRCKLMVIQVKRVYEPSTKEDGARFLVERLWPRGMKKEALHMDAWCKNLAPSDDLRRWFSHDPAKWKEFQRRYRAELVDNPAACQPLLEAAQQ